MADKSYQKGITVEIGGNTAPLNKALGDMGKQSRDLQTELKQIEKLLQVDPKNTELLAQKQKLLADSVKVTGDRLDVLRQAQEKFIAEGGKVDSAAYRDLQRDVIATEQKLGGLQKESKQTGDTLDKAGNSAKEAGDKAEKGENGWKKLGAGLANVAKVTGAAVAATSAAVGAAGVAAVKLAADYETSLTKVTTIADTSVKSIEAISQETIALSNQTGVSANEINESLYQAISAGADTADAMGLVEVAVKAAKGGFSDTTTAVDGLTTVLNAYNLETTDAEKIANQFLVTQNKGKTTFGELASTIGNVVPTAQAAGVATDELLASVASLTANGINTSTAMTGMKAALSNIIKPSQTAADTADALGINFSVAGLQSKGWAGFLDELKTATGGNLETMGKLFGSTEALNSVLTLTSESGMALFTDSMTEMEQNSGALEDAYNKMAGTTEEQFKKVQTNVTNLGITIGSALLPEVAKVTEEISGYISQITDAFSAGGIDGVADSMGSIISEIITNITAELPNLLAVGTKILESLINGISQSLPELATGAANILTTLTSALLGMLPELLNMGIQLLGELALGIAQALPELIPQAVEAVLTLAENLLNNVDMLIDAALQLVTGLADGVIEALPILIDKAPDIIQKLVDAIINNLPKLVTAALELVIKLGSAIIESLPELYKAAYEIIESIGSGIIEYAGNLIKSAEEVISTIWDKIVNADWLKLGADILAGIGNGISGAVKGITDTVKNVSDQIVGGFKSFFQIKSPSRLMQEIGGYIMEGMAIGINDNGDMPVDAMTEISQNAAQVATENAESFKDFGKLYVDNLSKGMNGQKANAVKTVQALFDQQIASIKNKNLKAEYEKFGKEAISSYSKAIEAGAKEAEAIIKTRVQAITDEFQKQYDDLLKQQESMRAKLAGFGDMFTIDEEGGEVQLANIRDNINALTRYDNALTALKGKGVSDNFLSEVTALSVNEATLFAEKLMSLSDKQFSAYTANWERQQSKAKEIATKFYADELDALQKNFAGQIDTEMAKVPGLMNGIGQNSIQGWIDGVNGQMETAKASVQNFANQMIATAETALGINSPSKEFAEIGGYMAEGMGVGFTDKLGGVSTGMQTAIGGVGSLTAAEALNAINSGIMSNVGMLNQAVEAIVNQVLYSLQARQMSFQQQGMEMIKRMTAGVNSTVSQLTGQVSQMMQQTLALIGGFQPKFVTTGENMVNGIWQGFQNKQSWLESQVRGMMQSIVSAVESEMDINSPSKVFAEIGGFMAEGLGLGFAEEMRREQERIDGAIPVDFENPRGGKAGVLQSTANAGTSENRGITNVTVNNYSPKSLTEAESAKQTKRALRDLALGVS